MRMNNATTSGALLLGVLINSCSNHATTSPDIAPVSTLLSELASVSSQFNNLNLFSGQPFAQTVNCPAAGTASISGIATSSTTYVTFTYSSCAMAVYVVRDSLKKYIYLLTGPSRAGTTTTVTGHLTVGTSDRPSTDCAFAYTITTNPDSISGTICGLDAAAVLPGRPVP